MSEQTITLPGVSDDDNRLLGGLLERLTHTQPRNEMLSAYYDMHRLVRHVSTVLPPMYQKLAMTLGWSAKGVDALSRRCRLTGFTWPGGDLSSIGFDEVWTGNMLASEARQGGLESLIHGPAFIINTLGGVGEPPALIHFKSALDATGEWDARARRMSNLLSITDRSEDGKEVTGLALYLDGVTVTAKKDGARWEADRQEHAWGVPAEPMVYKPRIRRPLGSSRISRAARGHQDAAIRELMRLEGHMDVFSFPELILLGANETVFRAADGSPLPVWQAMMGRIKGIPDDQDQEDPALARADVKQFAASSPEPHLAAINTHAKLMARELSLPDTALAITDVSNPTSAESYDASQYELIAEAEGTVDDWSPALRRSMLRALTIANGLDETPAEWASIEPMWRNPRFLSRAAEADAGMKQIQSVQWLGETEVGLELLGLTEQQRTRALAERRRARSQQMLTTLTAAAPAPETDEPTDDADAV